MSNVFKLPTVLLDYSVVPLIHASKNSSSKNEIEHRIISGKGNGETKRKSETEKQRKSETEKERNEKKNSEMEKNKLTTICS